MAVSTEVTERSRLRPEPLIRAAQQTYQFNYQLKDLYLYMYNKQ